MVRLDGDNTIENLEEGNNAETVVFSWGTKAHQSPVKDFQLYESFHYNGAEYHRKDCVYLWGEDKLEPYIGKIMKIWEIISPERKNMVKIVWFFRPVEIQTWLGDYKPLKNELFLASGKGAGVFTFNPLEAIAGKCKVICTSRDTRNIPASAEELKKFEFFFRRTFDVDTYKTSTRFPDFIARHDVKPLLWAFHSLVAMRAVRLYFNHNKNAEARGRPVARSLTVEDGKQLQKRVSKSKYVAAGCGKRVRSPDNDTSMKQTNIVPKEVTRIIKSSSPLGKSKFKIPTVYSPRKKKRRFESTSDDLARQPEHGGRFLESKVGTSAEPAKFNFNQKSDNKAKWIFDKKTDKDRAESQILEVTKRPNMDKRNWFHQTKDWDERMRIADKDGSLVLLQNLDPSYTSSEVEDIIWNALKKHVSAKMVKRTSFSSHHFGEAYVIFNTKESAESAMYELYNRPLVLTGGRPVVACKQPVERKSSSTPSKYPGHIVIEKLKFMRLRKEMRDAVSTSHYSQPNTVEYDMAMEWRALQEKSRLWWDALHKNQAFEGEKYRAQLKTDFNVLTEVSKPTKTDVNLPTQKPKLTL